MIKKQNPALAVVVLLGSYLLVTSAFFLLDFLSVFDAKRILQLALFVVVLIFALVWTPLRTATVAQLSRLSVLQRVCLALFFFIGIVSSLRLEHPAYALVDVSMMFVMMVLIAVVAASRELSGSTFDKWAVSLLAAMGFVVVLQELMGFIAGWVFGTEFNYDQSLIHFAHPRFYNQLQTWSIPIIAALPLLFPKRRWIKIGCVTLLGLQWFLVIAVAARGTVVSLFTAMVFIALWLPTQRKFWVRYQIAGVAAGIVIYFSILNLNGLIIPQAQSGEFYSHSVGRPMAHTSGRSIMWRFSIEDGVNNPVLGTGPTLYACDRDITLPAHPHNFLLRILGEWGLIAALIAIILAVTIGLKFLKEVKNVNNNSDTDPPLKSVLSISLIAGILHACLSGLMIMPASQVALVLIGGWVLSSVGNPPQQRQVSNPKNLVLLVGMALAFSQFAFAIKELPHLAMRTSYSANYGSMMPRFWQDGRVCEYQYVLLPTKK